MTNFDNTNQPFELPVSWKLPKQWAEWAISERNWTLSKVKKVTKLFHESQTKRHTTRHTWDEWELAFRAWVRREKEEVSLKDAKYQGHLCNTIDCQELGVVSDSTTGGNFKCWAHSPFNAMEGLENVLSQGTEGQT